ncbi:MAG: hypothetical protein COV31_00430 [Candidatus Yanofskybacteria bacterium CG10_big_fil_rev_8_21_14_0_10_46_23]|uniref:RNA polymerase subunit sigma-24 n=1 Tax=Candidatus Yanofskybacteria bacterium CG10_big_fil_rev_8_21_14_0_10_46_23 TaxID=1975098 RepID=A0A2H0R4W9_9BACT|nr:MAG: hypothetical protein COV31_00430 [Candidatus Yanofskybacteria bacterium CG10_big_fil_rev_8_21_14_0_10_46_23]
MNEGQGKKFVAVYRQYFPKIYKYCLFRLNSKEDAEDLTEQTFLRTWDYLIQGNEIENFRAFLFRVAHNQVIDLYSKREIDRKHSEPLINQEGRERDLPDETDLLADNQEKELYQEAQEELDQLKPEYREVMILYYVEDLDLSEIAEILGLTEGNVRVRLHRARNKLKEAMR